MNGREERQLVEDLVQQHPSGWQSAWLRRRAIALKDEQLLDWAAYYERIQKELDPHVAFAAAC